MEFSYDLENMTAGLLQDMENTVVKEKEAVINQLQVWEEHMREMNGNEKRLNFTNEYLYENEEQKDRNRNAIYY